MGEHTLTGNCWADPYRCRFCGDGNLCDVCHDHDEPRGACSECPPCEACDQSAVASGPAKKRGG